MNYLKKYKSFVNSQHFGEGVRITTGVLVPAFLMSYFHMLSTGISISLGALFVSLTDSAGPIHHRRNGMVVCIAAILLVTTITGFAINSPVLLAIFIFVCCFFFSMIGVFGARAASIGTATMIVLTLSIDPRLKLTTATEVVQHSLLIGSGGLWYMCFSMLLYTFRPYRLAQQALGDSLQSIAEYLQIRSKFYKNNQDYEKTYTELLQQQSEVQRKQNELTEILFKTRNIVKESTNASRRLMLIHLDASDIFEKIMMSYQEYSRLHEYFDDTDILDDYYSLAQEISKELDNIGIAVKSDAEYSSTVNLQEKIIGTRNKLDELRVNYLKPDNIEGFISLRRILENIQDLADRLTTLEKCISNVNPLKKSVALENGYEKLISSQEITPNVFIDNFTLKSDTFRHSLRVSIAVTAGFFVTQFFKVGHGYWILLTIIVILKPAFSLTKTRNRDRIGGTILGILIGVAILLTTTDSNILLIFLILFMIAGYTFMRTNYFVSVLLMTPYLLLFYHLLNPADFKLLLKDRVVDTFIGSSIAVIASTFLFPTWERQKIRHAMEDMLVRVKEYFSVIETALTGTKINPSQEQVARKNTLVALANLSDAFNRMLSEPKSQQKGIEMIHQFVVLSHTLTSYIATLSYYEKIKVINNNLPYIEAVLEDVKQIFSNAISFFDEGETFKAIESKDSIRNLNDHVNTLLLKRKKELEQGLLETSTRRPLFELKSISDQINLIYNVAVEITKITQRLAPTLTEE